MTGAEEGHDLISHGVERETPLTLLLELLVLLGDERENVLCADIVLSLVKLLADDLRGLIKDDTASSLHVAVHLGWDMLRGGDEGLNSVKHAGEDVESKHHTIGLADRNVR